jgi:CheY-like chemotaxis protein
MTAAARSPKILLIDTNVYFSKRLSDALKREGFEVNSSTQPAFALTTLEYDAPTAIVCSTNMREMGALDIARMIRADAKNAAMPVIALGDGGQRALMEAFQAGCDDYIDRTRPPAVIATHVKNIIVSKAEGFKPTQMLVQSDTSLSGSLTHHDLPGVMQMLGHAHQTGALHINSAETDALLFFDAGAITHAECGSLFGDEAVIHILKNCFKNNSGEYKFVYGSASTQRTVLRSATDLMLDAMREVDESTHRSEDVSAADLSPEEALPSVVQESAGPVDDNQLNAFSAPEPTDDPGASVPEADPVVESSEAEPVQTFPQDGLTSIRHSNDFSAAPLRFVESEASPVENSFEVAESEETSAENPLEAAEEVHDSSPQNQDDFAAITEVLDRFAMLHSHDNSNIEPEIDNFEFPKASDRLAESESFNHFTGAPLPDEPAAAPPVENSETPSTETQTDDHTGDQPVVTRHEEAL